MQETIPEDDEPAAPPPIHLGVVVARILVVSAMGFAGAIAIFFLVGGFWLIALAGFAATILFMFLMFAIERVATP